MPTQMTSAARLSRDAQVQGSNKHFLHARCVHLVSSNSVRARLMRWPKDMSPYLVDGSVGMHCDNLRHTYELCPPGEKGPNGEQCFMGPEEALGQQCIFLASGVGSHDVVAINAARR
jgi:hypothetical protein